MEDPPGGARLVVASNRGPGLVRHEGGGGLIAIVGSAIAEFEGAVWVSASQLRIDAGVYDSYYGRISTGLLWFAHHHLLGEVFDSVLLRDDWRAYEAVNALFAEACARAAGAGATVLLLDYHLALAPALLRSLRPDLRIVHCTMCPWAEPAFYKTLPMWLRRKLIEGMLGADSLSFFVPRWRDAFLSCCAALGFRVPPEVVRSCPVGVAPLSLSVASDELSNVETLVGGRRLVLRVDRLDPAKNILRGLQGFGLFLERYPSWRGRVVHYVLAYESRTELPEYRTYATRIRELVSELNGRFGSGTVLLDTRNNLYRAFALMALADVLVVNPVRDGMNLVVKETAAVNRRDCAIILSRDAGAADELGPGALLIDPFDVPGLAGALAAGLEMEPLERKRRLALMRDAATAIHPRQWLDAVLSP